MEIKSVIFQDLESFGKGEFFKMAIEKYWIFVWENTTISYNVYDLLSYETPLILCLFILLNIIKSIIQQKEL